MPCLDIATPPCASLQPPISPMHFQWTQPNCIVGGSLVIFSSILTYVAPCICFRKFRVNLRLPEEQHPTGWHCPAEPRDDVPSISISIFISTHSPLRCDGANALPTAVPDTQFLPRLVFLHGRPNDQITLPVQSPQVYDLCVSFFIKFPELCPSAQHSTAQHSEAKAPSANLSAQHGVQQKLQPGCSPKVRDCTS